MIIVKIINQKVVQVAFAGQLPAGQQLSSLLSASRGTKKQLAYFARNLSNSTSQNQKVTSANKQQHLIPIARNISFRQCRVGDQSTKANSQLSFSISAAQPFISADVNPSAITIEEEQQQRESPFETLKRKAKDVREKRELAAKGKYYGQSFNETVSAAGSERRLVVLMSWLEAKEQHIEKYRQFYLDRGFDVLNVKTSPLDLLLPTVGAKKISQDFLRFLVEKQYSDMVLHGFSVGGFMFGQILLDIDRQNEQTRQKLLNSIRGIVFDSLVPLEGTCIGVSRSITKNKHLAKAIEYLIRGYLVVGHDIATKYYLEASEKVWGVPLKCPSLFLMSKDDVISDHKIVENLIDIWSKGGVETDKMLVESSPHVQLFTKHHDAYVEKVEGFLRRIKLAN